MVQDQEHILLELEYYCDKNDDMWNMPDEQMKSLAMSELKRSKIVSNKTGMDANSIVLRIEEAYPVYSGTYNELHKLHSWINQMDNIYCVGRNGQHHYNNMDHSMETAIAAVDYIVGNSTSKRDIWAVNTQPTYHENERK